MIEHLNTADERIRLKCLEYAATLMMGLDTYTVSKSDTVIAMAKKFEAYVKDNSKNEDSIFIQVLDGNNEARKAETSLMNVLIKVNDGAEHIHQPVQHRDGKPPWCNTCGLTAEGKEPRSRFRKSAAAKTPGIHQEPDCHDENCNYQDPHKHGFACDKSCICEGQCHPDCPAHAEHYGEMVDDEEL